MLRPWRPRSENEERETRPDNANANAQVSLGEGGRKPLELERSSGH